MAGAGGEEEDPRLGWGDPENEMSWFPAPQPPAVTLRTGAASLQRLRGGQGGFKVTSAAPGFSLFAETQLLLSSGFQVKICLRRRIPPY